ncbi:hypothetical protein CEXT_476171 [Caerostris extrusa]|uniref:Uncharacterized protein n=1 Tax=Caerostris extrusa TaxID=172846 RepID=A0AAV4WC98_CAEEX|nr:hypothetical protein CEXT_476171 [Caerostris extrusa]
MNFLHNDFLQESRAEVRHPANNDDADIQSSPTLLLLTSAGTLSTKVWNSNRQGDQILWPPDDARIPYKFELLGPFIHIIENFSFYDNFLRKFNDPTEGVKC